MMGEQMEKMSQEERADFIKQQMDSLQHELEKASEIAIVTTRSEVALAQDISSHGEGATPFQADMMISAMTQAAQGMPDAADTAMSQQEQAGFLKEISKSGKAA